MQSVDIGANLNAASSVCALELLFINISLVFLQLSLLAHVEFILREHLFRKFQGAKHLFICIRGSHTYSISLGALSLSVWLTRLSNGV